MTRGSPPFTVTSLRACLRRLLACAGIRGQRR
nr:MAG TPA: hypothetical protein [Caudoviricetes sp.]